MDTAQRSTPGSRSPRSAYRKNLDFVRRRLGPGVELAAVVKSNAYGHGWREIAGLAVRNMAPTRSAVHSLEEALALRGAGFPAGRPDPRPRAAGPARGGGRPGFPADPLQPRKRPRARRDRGSGGARGCGSTSRSRPAPFRQGIAEEDLPALLDFLRRHPLLELEGAATHFANIEDTTDHRYAEVQLAVSSRRWPMIERGRLPLRKRHAACSAAILLFPETHFDLVRLGISQYGFFSSRETLLSCQNRHGQGGGDALRSGALLEGPDQPGQMDPARGPGRLRRHLAEHPADPARRSCRSATPTATTAPWATRATCWSAAAGRRSAAGSA